MTTAARIEKVCDDLKQMLLDKNAAYGDSATSPLRIFSKADHLEGIRVRVDDKLSRLSRGTPYPGDNDVLDLVGYLILFLSMQGEGNPCADIAPPVTSDRLMRYLDSDGDLWTRALDGNYNLDDEVKRKGVASYDYLSCRLGPLRSA